VTTGDRPSPDYPTSFTEIPAWASENRVPPSEARRRFAQYAILAAIASSSSLRRLLVFKGGNAQDFVWSPNCSTLDLDFSADMQAAGANDIDEAELGRLLTRALIVSERELGVAMAVHGVRRQPPGEGKTFVTYTARIGYALQDDPRNRTRLGARQPSSNVVPVEVSINEPIGADETLPLGGTRALRVSTIDDIVAEKLRAFLQQKGTIRNRNRPQDLLDIAYLLGHNTPLDRGRISRFLLDKAEARYVPVSKAAFRDPELSDRASQALRDTVRGDFIPFDEALGLLYLLAEELHIPEE